MRPGEQVIDRDALFEYLERRANKRGQIVVHHTGMAKLLGVNNDTVTKAMRDLVEAGRIQRISTTKTGVVYSVRPQKRPKK